MNGNFSQFLDPSGGITTDPSQAQTFFILGGELFTIDGLHVQANEVDSIIEPYILFIGSDGNLTVTTTFCLTTLGIAPLQAKRQAVGLTVLYWVNASFQAPSTLADFCVYNNQVYAVLQSRGVGADFYAVCTTITLSAFYCKPIPRFVHERRRTT